MPLKLKAGLTLLGGLLPGVSALSCLGGGLGLRQSVPVVLASVLGGFLLAPPDARLRRPLVPWLVGSVLLALAPAWTGLRVPGAYETAALGLGAVAGWAAMFWQVVDGQAPLPAAGSQWWEHRARWLAAALGVAATGTAALLHRAVSGDVAILQDEVLYLLQGSWFAAGRLGWPLEPDLLPALRPEYTFYRDGVIYAQYPPGWPLLLALFGLVGLRWWATPLLAGATVVAVYHLGRRLHSPAAGVLAALLLATHAWFVAQSFGYMSHMATAACLTTAAVLMLPTPSGVPPRAAHWGLAGGLLGLTVAIRPLTGVVMGLTLALWLTALQPAPWEAWLARVRAVALGALLPVGGVLWYNALTTGDPLQLGYGATHGALHDLGFGPRGFMLHGGAADPQPVTHQFTPAIAIARLGGQLQLIAERLLPVGLLVPLGWFAAREGVRPAWRLLMPLLLLPVAHCFYFFTATERFLTELLPFAMAGTGWVLARLGTARAAGRVHRLVVLLVALNVVATSLFWAGERRGRSGHLVRRNAEAIAALPRDAGPTIVLIREPGPEWYQFRRLSVFNADGLEGEVVVARDRGDAVPPLLARLPGRAVYRATLVAPGRPLRLERLAGSAGRGPT